MSGFCLPHWSTVESRVRGYVGHESLINSDLRFLVVVSRAVMPAAGLVDRGRDLRHGLAIVINSGPGIGWILSLLGLCIKGVIGKRNLWKWLDSGVLFECVYNS